jgi:hypothetical protein
MDYAQDPNDRRRVAPERQRQRDAEVACLRRANTPFRVIAARLGMSLGAVQKSMRRHQALAVAGQLALVDALTADDVTSAEDVARLNPLERERLRHVAADSAPGVALAEYVATHPQPSCRHRPAVDPG